MIVLLALMLLALIAGLFYGLGSDPRRQALLQPPRPPALPSAEALPGGDPLRAIVVESPAVIEGHAERWPCPVCASEVRCVQHRAEQIADRRLRVARVRCPRCGFERDLFFALNRSDS